MQAPAPSSNPFDSEPDTGAACSLGADLAADVDALMSAENLETLMEPTDVKLLRQLLEALQRDEALHARLHTFVSTHCAAFASYGTASEHQLEWTALHAEYSQMFEQAIESVLSSSGRPAWELFGLVQAALGSDPRARSFVSALLGWTDYTSFCELMQRPPCRKEWAILPRPGTCVVWHPWAVGSACQAGWLMGTRA